MGPSKVDVHVAADADAASRFAAARVEELLAEGLDQRERAHIALAGGNTPIPAYELAARRIGDWSRVDLWFGDERAVPPDDPESNFRAVSAAFGQADGLDQDAIHRIEGELGPERAAARYAEEISARIPTSGSGIPVLEIAFQGIGPDGHTASLFPRHPALEADGLCVGVHGASKPPPERISMTLPLLRAARRIVFLVTGREKAQAVARMLAGPDPEVPASMLAGPNCELIADSAAASEI
jgi:6-phosphogluconolactonase